jgi:hypothetical protein
MKTKWIALGALTLLMSVPLGTPALANAQTFPTDDPVIRQMWSEGMVEENSQAYSLAQVLLDSIGPRLTGTPQYEAAGDWLLSRYAAWGIDVEKQQYGTWRGWERGITHIDLVSPRLRTLKGMLLAWSGGTDGPVEAEVIALPEFSSAAEFEAWLPEADGKFVSISYPEPTCRAPESWEEWATAASWEKMQAERSEARTAWARSMLAALGQARGGVTGLEDEIARRLEAAGAAGVFRGLWSNGWGADKIFDSSTAEMPSVHLDCEDYGLVTRLAQQSQSPRVRLEAEAEWLGEVPAFNVVATIPGAELPDEYVLLGAHLDSWDGASGATDNGTGTIMMLEAARILKAAYPNPRRTIVVGHWGAEEQGLIGSTAFAADNPEVVDGMQAGFNQDNGTWRVDYIRMMGFTGAGEHFARWFSAIPNQITDHIELDVPGMPESGGSDHMSFICKPVPAFRFQSNYPDYRQYTWHTGIDTFDKIVFDDLRNNATLAAMVAYMASEDPEQVSRETRVLPDRLEGPQRVSRRTMASSATGQWPQCRPPRRSFGG